MSIEYFSLPAEFRTGMFLSAAMLNHLGDSIGYLDGRINAVNVPRSSLKVDTALSVSNNTWRCRHHGDCDYLHYNIDISGNSGNPLSQNLEIHFYDEEGTYLGETTIDATPTEGEAPYEGYIDITSYAFDNGEWYRLHVVGGGGSSYNIAVRYLDESNSTSLAMPTPTGASRPASGPFDWQHGDLANSAPTMDLYSDWLDYLRDRVGQVIRNPAVLEDREQGVYPVDEEDSGLTFFHQLPWLVFRGTGELIDPAGVGDTVTLSDEDELTAYDLSTVSWLHYGDRYLVSGCDFACEALDVS